MTAIFAPFSSAPRPAPRELRRALRDIQDRVVRGWRGPTRAWPILTEAGAWALGVGRVSLWQVTDGGKEIRCLDQVVSAEGRHDSGQVLAGRAYPTYFGALQSEPYIAADDARADLRTREFAGGYLLAHGITSMLDVPVRLGGRATGVLCFEHTGDARHWEKEEIEFAQGLAELAALVVATAVQETAEHDLVRSRERYRRFFEGTEVALWEADLTTLSAEITNLRERNLDLPMLLDEDPELVSRLARHIEARAANGAAVTMLGAAHEADLLQYLLEVFDQGDSPVLRALIVALWDGRGSFEVETSLRSLDGRKLDLMVSARLPVGAQQVIVNIVDITERRQMERLLQEVSLGAADKTGQDYFEAMVEQVAKVLGADLALVGELGPDGDVEPLAVRHFGKVAEPEPYSPEGTPCGAVLRSGAALFPQRVRELFPRDERLGRLDAQAYLGVPLVDDSGTTCGLAAAIFTEPLRSTRLPDSVLRILASRAGAELQRLRAEQERSSLQTQLLRAQRLESVGRLAGGIAHDFNNLLAPILAYSELGTEKVGADHPAAEELSVIHDAAVRASRLTRQLLTFSRQREPSRSPLELNDVVGGFTGILRSVLSDGVRMELRLSPDLPPVEADAGQLEQTLMNLVVNAQAAMPDGGELTVCTDAVTLPDDDAPRPGGLPPGTYCRLSVEDSGVGMDADVLANIFEPFFTTKTAQEGTGLGLATVYGIAQQHGGTIVARSAPGEGSTFELYLPALATEAEDDVGAPTSTEGPAEGTETVLVVEDEPAVRTLVVTILRRLGYEVLQAGNPDEAMTIMEARGDHVDLLLTDVVMPGMDGVELFGRLRGRWDDLTVLFMSGYAHSVLAERGVQPGTLTLLDKPFSVAELAARVRQALDSRASSKRSNASESAD